MPRLQIRTMILERSGCQRKRTAGEMPMSDLTNHTHGGFYIVQFTRRESLNQSAVKYGMQLSMINFLYSKNMLSKNEYEKIKNKLRIKYTK